MAHPPELTPQRLSDRARAVVGEALEPGATETAFVRRSSCDRVLDPGI
jgi:hypothetical protein